MTSEGRRGTNCQESGNGECNRSVLHDCLLDEAGGDVGNQWLIQADPNARHIACQNDSLPATYFWQTLCEFPLKNAALGLRRQLDIRCGAAAIGMREVRMRNAGEVYGRWDVATKKPRQQQASVADPKKTPLPETLRHGSLMADAKISHCIGLPDGCSNLNGKTVTFDSLPPKIHPSIFCLADPQRSVRPILVMGPITAGSPSSMLAM